MVVTIEWLVAQPDLDLRLVAGSASGRRLTWAHAIEVGDPTPWLNGGELVLTTGLHLDTSPEVQRDYVDKLAARGVAGLGFGVGLRYDQVPDALLERCAELDLPLLEVPLPTPFIAIEQALVRRLSEQEMEDLQRALEYQRRVTRSAVRGGLPAIVGVLGRELRADVVVLDEYGAVMASSSRSRSLLQLVEETWRQVAADPRAGTAGFDTAHGVLELQTLRGRSAVVGWLVVRHQHDLSSTARLLLNQTAGLITLQLDWPAELIAAYHSLGGALLDLMLDTGQEQGRLTGHLRHFGFQPAAEVMLVLATSQGRHARIQAALADKLEATSRPHLVTRVAEGVAALVTAADAPTLVDLLVTAIDDAGVSRVVLGDSGRLASDAVAGGLAPAVQAAAAARREGRRIGWFDELTLGTVVADDVVRARIHTLTAPALAALEHGASSREADLLPSLEAFLLHNGSWEGAARALGVHRHTLKARMARVEDLTGLRLDSAENRVLLLLALMSRRGTPAR